MACSGAWENNPKSPRREVRGRRGGTELSPSRPATSPRGERAAQAQLIPAQTQPSAGQLGRTEGQSQPQRGTMGFPLPQAPLRTPPCSTTSPEILQPRGFNLPKPRDIYSQDTALPGPAAPTQKLRFQTFSCRLPAPQALHKSPRPHNENHQLSPATVPVPSNPRSLLRGIWPPWLWAPGGEFAASHRRNVSYRVVGINFRNPTPVEQLCAFLWCH